ncbi:MAG: prepilin-type N-terminal cleavage/methylation domain-containing protein [Candidatus Brennerbacteria bacterium]|nr:prepilin-type N-terminal cleavage/methylation domain-containing protein [Candidatus Brennerbacteria bacterium]
MIRREKNINKFSRNFADFLRSSACYLRLSASKEKGFTIIELILYVLIFAIIGTLAAAVFGLAIKSKTTIGRSGEVQLNVQKAVDQMIDRVHSSLAINDASSTLSLKMSDSAKDPTIFALASGTITIQESSSPAAAITPSSVFFTSLNFTKINNIAPATSSVQIKITGGYNSAGVADSSTLYSIQTTAMPL